MQIALDGCLLSLSLSLSLFLSLHLHRDQFVGRVTLTAWGRIMKHHLHLDGRPPATCRPRFGPRPGSAVGGTFVRAQVPARAEPANPRSGACVDSVAVNLFSFGDPVLQGVLLLGVEGAEESLTWQKTAGHPDLFADQGR